MLWDETFDLGRMDREPVVLERLVAEFERGWKRDERPAIERFLTAAGCQRPAVLVELVHAELEFRLEAGEPARVEDYLRRFPELQAQESVVLDLITAEFRRRRSREPGLGREEYTERFGRLGADLPTSAHVETEHRPGRTVSAEVEVVCSPDDADRCVESEGLRSIGRYELLEVIGRGGAGIVYRARDTELGRQVAVKIPRSDQALSGDAVERFLREARSAAVLRHPNIVPVYDAGRVGSMFYLVSAFVRGIAPNRRLAGGPTDFCGVARLIAEVADALHYAHAQGVIHRDLKPSNILIDVDGRPHVLDFGLAKSAVSDDETLTLEGQILGTPAYMSPELARGEAHRADARSDVYSLGVVLYELLTGERPFCGQGRMILIQVLEAEPRSPRRLDDRIPRDLETICLKAMAKEPSRRYSTAGAMAEDLRRFLRGEAVRARPLGPAGRLWRRCLRKPLTAATAAALALAVVLGLAGVTWQWGRAEAHASEVERQRSRTKLSLDRAHAAVVAFAHLGRDRTLIRPEGRPVQQAMIRVALDYYRDIIASGRNKPAILAEVAAACQGIAELEWIIGSSGEGILAGENAVEAWETLVRKDPDRRDFLQHLAEASDTLAAHLRFRGRTDESLRSFARAGALWESLIRREPTHQGYGAALARHETALGILLKKLGRREEALRAFRHARDLYDGLDWKTGSALEERQALASCLYYLVEILRLTGKIDEAMAAVTRYRNLTEALLREQPNFLDFQIMRAKADYLTGALLSDRSRFSDAIDAYRAAAERFTPIVAILPETPEIRRDLGASHHNVGNLLVYLGRFNEAAAAYRSAIANREEVLRLQPDRPVHRSDLAGTWRNLGETLERLGRHPSAIEAYRRADELGPEPPVAASREAGNPHAS